MQSTSDADRRRVYRGEIARNSLRIGAAAACVGHINVIADPDSVVRRIPASIGSGSGPETRLPVGTAAVLSHPRRHALLTRVESTRVRLPHVDIPLDEYGRIPVNFVDFERDAQVAGAADPCSAERSRPIVSYSFREVFEACGDDGGSRAFRSFKGMVAIVETGSERELHETPFGRQSRAMIQASFVHSLLTKRLIRVPRPSVTLACLIALCVPLGMLALREREPFREKAHILVGKTLLLLVALFGLGCLSWLLYSRWGLMIHVTPFALMIVLHFGLAFAASLDQSAVTAERRDEQLDLMIRLSESASPIHGAAPATPHRSETAAPGEATPEIPTQSAAERVLEPLIASLRCDGYALYVADPERDSFASPVVRGFRGGLNKDRAMGVADSVNVRLQETGEPLLVADAASDPTLHRVGGMRSMLSVPLTTEGRVTGALHLFNRLPSRLSSTDTFTDEDLRLTAATARQMAIAIDNERLYGERERISAEKQRLEGALEVAREIQKRLLPRDMPLSPHFDAAACNVPCEQTAGDYHDFIRLDEEHVALSIADVGGHGIGPALMMAETRALLRAAAMGTTDAGEALSVVNEKLANDLPDEWFVTPPIHRRPSSLTACWKQQSSFGAMLRRETTLPWWL